MQTGRSTGKSRLNMLCRPSSAAELVDFEQQLEQFRGNTLKDPLNRRSGCAHALPSIIPADITVSFSELTVD